MSESTRVNIHAENPSVILSRAADLIRDTVAEADDRRWHVHVDESDPDVTMTNEPLTQLYTVRPGHVVQGTSLATGRVKNAKGTGSFVRTERRGFYGTVTVLRWSNGVETYHCANLTNAWIGVAEAII